MLLDIVNSGPLEVNTYILKDEISKEAVVIDVGGDFVNIYNSLDSEGYNIKYILNTHGHFDHILGEGIISVKYPDIPVYMSKDDISHLEKLNSELAMWGYDIEAQPPKITDYIDENSNLFIGQNKIKILKTPGHSKGSLSFYIEKANSVFTGDALFYRSIGRTDFYDGDYNTLITSIKTKILTLPDNTTVYPGHGPKTSVIDEKNYNSYLE